MLNEQDVQRIVEEVKELRGWKESLESSFSIPLNIDQSFRGRFKFPSITVATLDFGNTGTQSSSTLTVTFPGAGVGDLVTVTPPIAAIVGNLGGIFVGYVSAADTVSIRFINPDTGSSLNPASGEFTIALFKK